MKNINNINKEELSKKFKEEVKKINDLDRINSAGENSEEMKEKIRRTMSQSIENLKEIIKDLKNNNRLSEDEARSIEARIMETEKRNGLANLNIEETKENSNLVDEIEKIVTKESIIEATRLQGYDITPQEFLLKNFGFNYINIEDVHKTESFLNECLCNFEEYQKKGLIRNEFKKDDFEKGASFIINSLGIIKNLSYSEEERRERKEKCSEIFQEMLKIKRFQITNKEEVIDNNGERLIKSITVSFKDKNGKMFNPVVITGKNKSEAYKKMPQCIQREIENSREIQQLAA